MEVVFLGGASAIGASCVAVNLGGRWLLVDAGVRAVRFYFPDVARERYAATLNDLAARSGWTIAVHPTVHQGALEQEVRRVLPAGLELAGPPSLYQSERTLAVSYRGSAAEAEIEAALAAFTAATGWHLMLRQG